MCRRKDHVCSLCMVKWFHEEFQACHDNKVYGRLKRTALVKGQILRRLLDFLLVSLFRFRQGLVCAEIPRLDVIINRINLRIVLWFLLLQQKRMPRLAQKALARRQQRDELRDRLQDLLRGSLRDGLHEGSGERQRPKFTVLICRDRGIELVAGRGGELRLALTLRHKLTLHTACGTARGSVWLCPTADVNTAKTAQCCCRWLSHLELFTPLLLGLMLLGHPPHAEEHPSLTTSTWTIFTQKIRPGFSVRYIFFGRALLGPHQNQKHAGARLSAEPQAWKMLQNLWQNRQWHNALSPAQEILQLLFSCTIPAPACCARSCSPIQISKLRGPRQNSIDGHTSHRDFCSAGVQFGALSARYLACCGY